MKTDADAVTHLPAGHSCTYSIHGSSNFMARHARKLDTGEAILLHVQITGANAASLDTQAHLTCPRRRHWLCRHLDSTAGMGKLGRTHGVPCRACSIERGTWLWGSHTMVPSVVVWLTWPCGGV
jgi:hypothetical protein